MTYLLNPQVIILAETAYGQEIDLPKFKPVTVTTYFPVPEQCDSSPFYTADGSFIDSSSKRWCAVSQDLLEDYSFGDTISIYTGDPLYNGKYIVHDCMHPRVKNCIDILIGPGDKRTGGLWKGILLWKDSE
jgi:3D (Asp-Asp-Asp) domain-containing protein